MTLIIDLNDMGVRCLNDGQLLHESPGVALVDNERLLFGDEALCSSRSQPLHTYSRFWSQLDVTPLNSGNRQVRHHADLAYLHLKHIETRLPQPLQGKDAIFSLSGQTDKQALGLLLGIARQCGLNTVGLVDTALASVLPVIELPQARHVEMHLHHAVVSELEVRDGQLQLIHLEVLPQLGWLDLHQHLLRYLSNEFIRQIRFNPRHHASSEQQLFNAISDYLQQAANQRVIECSLADQSIQLDAGLLRHEVVKWLQPLTARLDHTDQGCDLYIGDRLTRLGMYLQPACRPRHLTSGQVGEALTRVAAVLPGGRDGLRFTSALPCEMRPPVSSAAPASHLLCDSHAWPIAGTWSLMNDSRQPLQAGQKDAALALMQNHRIQPGRGAEIFINGQPLTQERGLQCGDTLSIGRHGPVYHMITVEP